MQVGQAAVLFRDKERDMENPSAVSLTSMLLSQEYSFLLTAFCSKIERPCKTQTHDCQVPVFHLAKEAHEEMPAMEGAMVKNLWNGMDHLLAFTWLFLLPETESWALAWMNSCSVP